MCDADAQFDDIERRHRMLYKMGKLPIWIEDISELSYASIQATIQRICLLNKHAIQQRTVQYYAECLGISSKYLSFVCTSYSKKNASAWIDEAVIQKAKAMILVHHYSLGETSEALHFPTVSSFSRYFKRVTGITPKDFANSKTL